MGGGCAFCRWKRLLCAWRRALYVWKRRCADVRAGTQAPPLPFLMWLRVIKLPKNSSPRHKYKCIVVANSSPHHKHKCIVVANSSLHHKNKCIVVARYSLTDEVEKRLLARTRRWRRGCFPTFLMGVFPQTSLVFTEKALTLQPYLIR